MSMYFITEVLVEETVNERKEHFEGIEMKESSNVWPVSVTWDYSVTNPSGQGGEGGALIPCLWIN